MVVKSNEAHFGRRAHLRLGNVARALVAIAAVTLSCAAQAGTYALVLKPNSAKRGTVTGGGKYEVYEAVTIKAAPKSGYVFAGWFRDKACKKALNPEGYDNRKPTVKIEMPESKTAIYAKFVSKAEAKKSLKFSAATKKLATTATKAAVGKSFSLALGLSSVTLPTFTAKGLPKGLSIDKTTGKISGAPMAVGSFTVVVVAKDAAGNKISQKAKLVVAAPAWVVGKFSGLMRQYEGSNTEWGEPGSVEFTVTSAGKISGKYVLSGDTTSFSGSGFSASGNLDSKSGKLTATVKSQEGVKHTIVVRPVEYFDGYMRGRASFKGSFNEDGKKFTNKSICIDQVMWTHPKKSKLPLPPIKKGSTVSGDMYGDIVKLKFGGNGAVTAVYKGGTSSTCISALSYNDYDEVWTAQVNLILPYEDLVVDPESGKSLVLHGLIPEIAVLEFNSSGKVISIEFEPLN